MEEGREVGERSQEESHGLERVRVDGLSSLPGVAADLGPQPLPWLAAPPQGLLQSSMSCTAQSERPMAEPCPQPQLGLSYAEMHQAFQISLGILLELRVYVGGLGEEWERNSLELLPEQNGKDSATFTGSPISQETSNS